MIINPISKKYGKIQALMRTFNLVLLTLISITFCHQAQAEKNGTSDPPFEAASVLDELTSHQWTLREIVQTKNDTATNLTLFLLPCEKDNQLSYYENGNYEITEGEARCKSTDDNVKGTGTWEYDANDNIIIDQYQEGRPIEKRILEINSGMMKVEYEGEGRAITTLTYFSEIGQQDEALQETIEDNSDHFGNITRVPREVMIEARRYAIIGRRDFDAGKVVTIDDRNGLVHRVVVFPFMDSTDPSTTVNEAERNSQLIAQALKSEIDYVITGNVFKAIARPTGNGKEGHVKYSVSILDVNKGEEIAQRNLEYPKNGGETNKNRSNLMNKIAAGAAVAGSSLRTFSYLNWYAGRRNNWYRFYRGYFAANSVRNTANDFSAYFSETDQDRNTYFEENLAIMESLEKTAEDLGKFVLENLPVTIPVNDLAKNKRGRVNGLVIEAGNNISVKVGEKMNIVRINRVTFSDGSEEVSKEQLGEIKISEVNGTRLSTGQITSGLKVVQQALEDHRDQVFVQTKEIAEEKE